MTGPSVRSHAELSQHFASIASVLLAPGGGPMAGETIVDLALSTMDNCDEAGLCAEADQSFAASHSGLIRQLDALQSEVGHGPCVDVLAGGDTVYVPDLLDDQRWPQFSPRAAGLGLRTALAYRLSVGGKTIGALQLFAQLPDAFNVFERAEGLVFATLAGLALAQAKAQQAEELNVENLQRALASREVIGQAQGILMQREKITADQAFQLLRRSSQHLNRKLRTVAQDVVDTGTIPPDVSEP